MFTSIELISSCTRNVEDSSATMRAFVGHSSSKANSSARLNEVGEFVSADYSMTKRLGKAAAPMDTV